MGPIMDRSRLDAQLAEVGRDVAFPQTPPIVDEVMRRLAEPPPLQTRRRRPLVALAVALVVVSMFTVLPGPRRAIADLLGIGGVAITIAPELPQTATAGEFSGNEVTLQAAQAAVEFALVVPDGIGEPDVVYLDVSVPGGLVTLAYQPGQNSFRSEERRVGKGCRSRWSPEH